MAEAITLARRGLRTCMPNPRVGCVIARDDEIVGRGWHQRTGEAHAEVAALEEAGSRARGATAYVTLEPCAHHGRTAPCAEALVAAGVRSVVAAMRDPNPRVDGGGLATLERAGIDTRTGLMADAARALNVGFLSRMERGRPWVRVKLAQSLDGRTALASGESRWITGTAARADVQCWRARACAVLTGVGTVLADDPSLTQRLKGLERQPLRVIADSRWRTPPEAKTLGLPGQVLIAGREDLEPAPALRRAAECLALPADGDRVDLAALLKALAEREINEVHVEAGGVLCGALLDRGLVDEVLLYQAPTLLGEGGRPTFVLGGPACMAERPIFTVLERVAVGDDLRMRLAPQHSEV
jgi:diaminohydroxyphosphoribosylaminopyrimidine deaminase/5-amino-6-(5-phosphoribosylamino)uracil reductase